MINFHKISSFFRRDKTANLELFRTIFERFQQILNGNNRSFELISQLDDILSGEYIFDINYIKEITGQLSDEMRSIVNNLNIIAENKYAELFECLKVIQEDIGYIIEGKIIPSRCKSIFNFDEMDPDCVSIIGAKNARLGEIRKHLAMAIPDGIALTVLIYDQIMETNNLWKKVDELYAQMEKRDGLTSSEYDAAIDELFRSAIISPAMEKQISKSLNGLVKRVGNKVNFAVRSSAWGEDEEGLSFAGQFETVLNCRRDEVLSAYLKVIASRFRFTAMEYGGRSMLEKSKLPMAVGIQQMIPSQTSGVMYTMSPDQNEMDCLLIAANFGLGISVVGGDVDTDLYRVSRLQPDSILEHRIGKKEIIVIPAEDGGVKKIRCPQYLRGQPCLTDNEILELTEKGLVLEHYFKRPLDIEWSIDEDGNTYILQCRPLKLGKRQKTHPRNIQELRKNWTAVIENRGQVAQRGIAAGRVWHIKEHDEASLFPLGAIAVTEYTTPRLVSIIRRASAIITDIGSSTGHMATVAREFGVPMMVNTEVATRLLKNGDEITVDAEENIVYRGIIRELQEYEVETEDIFREMREYRILKRIFRKISPLTMLNPRSPEFTAKNCKTYHDIIRFCHEKAVQALINLNMSSKKFRGIESKKLKIPIPISLSIIDLGGGLQLKSDKDEVESLDKIISSPMKAILKGLMAPGIWSTQPMHLGLSNLVSSITRFNVTNQGIAYQGHNLAVISNNYANINLRLGYHFNVVDTYVSENVNDNYIYFRFIGGVTESERRHLRAMLLKKILEALNLKVDLSGDLVVARLKKWESTRLLKVLEDIGQLIGFSRQLDTQMRDVNSVDEYFLEFFKRKEST